LVPSIFPKTKKKFRTHRISTVVAYWDPWLNDSERTRNNKNTKLTARKRKIRKDKRLKKMKMISRYLSLSLHNFLGVYVCLFRYVYRFTRESDWTAGLDCLVWAEHGHRLMGRFENERRWRWVEEEERKGEWSCCMFYNASR
jgi:hypothetical protein